MKCRSFACLVFLASSAAVHAESSDPVTVIDWIVEPVDTARDRIVPLKLYVPEADEPVPVVLFSHGLGGSRNNSPYLGTYWAGAGYAAVFIQHAGSDEDVWKNAPPARRMDAMKQAASPKAALDRLADVPFVINQLEMWNADAEHPLHGKLDLTKIGMCGHSFGAVTTQGVMGQKFPGDRTAEEPRLSAFFAMSPSAHRSVSPSEAFGHIGKPVLCMTGTADGSPIDPTTTPESRREVYAALPPGDKFQLVFDGGEHHAFGDGNRPGQKRFPHHHPAIQKISTAFWDAYLKGDAAAKSWLQSDGPRKELELAEKDVWEWK